MFDIFQFRASIAFLLYFQVIPYLSDSVCSWGYIYRPSPLLFLFLDNFNDHLVKMSEINETAPASPAALNAPSTKLTLVAVRLLRRPDRFERLYKTHLDALDGPRRLELMLEISNLT